jgi:hypothetical protein
MGIASCAMAFCTAVVSCASLLIRKILLTNCHKTLQNSLSSILPQALLSMLLCVVDTLWPDSLSKKVTVHLSRPQTMLHNGSWCICEDAKDPNFFANRGDILTLMQKSKRHCIQECHSHSHLLQLTSHSPLSALKPHLVCTAAIIHPVQPNILESLVLVAFQMP